MLIKGVYIVNSKKNIHSAVMLYNFILLDTLFDKEDHREKAIIRNGTDLFKRRDEGHVQRRMLDAPELGKDGEEDRTPGNGCRDQA